jgi:flagellar export protein FliJ
MKKFSYSLEGVLRVRRLQEEQTRAEIARLLIERNGKVADIRRMKEEIINCRKRLCGVGVVNAKDFTQIQCYIKGLSSKILELTKSVDIINMNLENHKNLLKIKIIETKKLKTHKTNEKESWKLESYRQEQAEFDEIASSRFRFNK